ncbi:MAG: UDP-N-acetylmuramoyl-tripeptide--D-alanyl-D-alanine ligase [Chitinivibrionales bacterium]|nr:UDP-N-acetylmuramoyl-tripeptide--D-alanyl-D-alanine ligase [Chitinivibrionales bacterium]
MAAESPSMLTFGRAAQWCGAREALPASLRNRRIAAVTNDSRTTIPGSLFVALRSERDDGHRYVADALAKGAAAALVARKSVNAELEKRRSRLLIVPDPLKALQRLAARYRREQDLLVVGITGSSGKTTTRSMLTAVLNARVPTGGTKGNWNNHIGVPLTLLSLRGDEYAAVVEMGANHVGEIRTLTRIARPDIAVVTNIGYAHVGLFGSLANTTRAKMEIIDGLNRREGYLMVNGDDRRLLRAARASGVRLLTFGIGRSCDIRAENVETSPRGTTFDVAGHGYRLSMPGRHFVYAALPAVALGLRVGLEPSAIAGVLREQKPVNMRGGIRSKKGVRFVLDCYNANPDSMRSALTLLSDLAPRERRIAVLGEMLELESYAGRLHRQLGRDTAAAGVRELIAAGEHGNEIASGAREKGMAARHVHVATDAAEALSALRNVVQSGDTVLLKASRMMQFEHIHARY